MKWFVVLTLMAVPVSFACSSGEAARRGSSESGGSDTPDGGSLQIDAGGTVVIDVDAGDGVRVHRPDLPPPWLYYAEGNEYGYKDPSFGADVRDAFNASADSSRRGRLVYPLDNSMHPMNLTDITFHWQPGNPDEKVFRIDATDGTSVFRFFVPCQPQASGCIYQMPESEWLDLGERFRSKSLSFTVSGVTFDAANKPLAVTESAPIQIHFSPEPVNGALYYWAAAQASIKRVAFGARKAVPYITPRSETNDFACAACHSVSRDGKVIAFAVSNDGGENVAAVQTAPTEDPAAPFVKPAIGTTPYPAQLANYPTSPDGRPGYIDDQPLDHHGASVALNPDGSAGAVVGFPLSGWPPFFELRNTVTGATLDGPYPAGDAIFGTGGSSRLPIWPEWSPDGKSIVAMVAEGDGCVWPSSGCGSGLGTMPVENNQLGQLQTIVSRPPEGFHFYPTWSPDGRWVAFASAVTNADKDGRTYSSSFADAVLRLVRVDGATKNCPEDCVELANGTQYTVADARAGRGQHSTWPKFAPFAQGPNGNVLFVTFTSRIPYGLVAENRTQLWMFAVDLDKVGTADPSYAPFWLPYQDIEDASLSPYWTETIPCAQDPQGGCVGCVGQESCVVTGDTCQCRADEVR